MAEKRQCKTKVAKFWLADRGPKGHKIFKIYEWEIFVTRLNNFSILRTLTPNFSEKVLRNIFELIGIFNQLEGGEHEYEEKTGTGSSFRCRFDEN